MNNNMDKEKFLLHKIEKLEDSFLILLKQSDFNDDKMSSETINEMRKDLKEMRETIEVMNKEREEIDDGRIYLSEVISKEKPKMTKNNMIISPVGSGKTHYSDSLIKDGDHVLFLVSTTSLKESMVPKDEKRRSKMKNRSYSTKQRRIYGEGSYKRLVMTYSEFGERIKFVDDFAKQFSLIICDEIHSLPLYLSYNNSAALAAAIKYLFTTHEEQPKYYFTATIDHINKFKKNLGSSLKNLNIVDYSNYHNIKKHTPIISYEMTGIEQIRPHLRVRLERFKYFNYKIFAAFCKTIEEQLKLQKICEEEGFNAQSYWSINNTDKKMTDEQINESQKMIQTGMLPDKYDVIIINSALQEGWNLHDRSVKLGIMNTLDETEFIQAFGRIRRNIETLIYKTDKNNVLIEVPDKYLNIDLNTEEKEKLCELLGVKNEFGRVYGWRFIKDKIIKEGYIVEDRTVRTDNNKRIRVTVIKKA